MKQIQLSIGVLLKSLKNIYDNSNFYKEARIVSFIDRLLTCIVNKIRSRCSLGTSIQQGRQGKLQDYMLNVLEGSKASIVKFSENFFIAEVLDKHESANDKVERALGIQPEERAEEEKRDPQMDSSFYRKEGLDFLYFQRPGTAYGSEAFMKGAGMGTATRSGFFDSRSKVIKPVEVIARKHKGDLL